MSLEDEFIENLNELLMDDTKENNNKLIATIKNSKFKVNNPIRYNGKNQFPLFICAGFFLKNEILQILLDKGANINAIDEVSNNILGYLITTIIEEDRDEDEDDFIRTFNFLMRKGANIYYVNSVSNLSIFDLVLELKQYFDDEDIEKFITKILRLRDREIIVKNNYYLYLLNSIFSKIGLTFKFVSDTNEKDAYFGIEPIKCDTKYGLYLRVNENNNIYVDLLSNCKKNSGTTILSLIKKFACKINSNEISLHDQQSLVLEHDKVINNIAILDIAVNGESWYNKMGFYRKGANPEEDKRINILKSHKVLSTLNIKKTYIDKFKEAFEIDSNIDVNDSIQNIFTIIKRDYLKNKTKKITKEQCHAISSILLKLDIYYDYDPILYYTPNCSKSTQSKSSSTRRRSFDSWKPKSSKSRKIYHSY
jgi:hypothetical protein